jgi:hypothetical protein
VWVDRGGFESEPARLTTEVIGPNEPRLYRSRDHFQNFLDCVRTRALTIAPAEVAHRSASVGHLGVIAIETGRTIKWDPATETLIGDPAAERLLSHSYRRPCPAAGLKPGATRPRRDTPPSRRSWFSASACSPSRSRAPAVFAQARQPPRRSTRF